MFPIIFTCTMVGAIILGIVSAIKEEIDANVVHRIYTTYLKRFKRRRKIA